MAARNQQPVPWSNPGWFANLTNGVSQQPPRVRLDSQQDEAVNVYPTTFHLMGGQRAPLEIVSQLSGLETWLDITTNGYPHRHEYVRDDTESYEIFFDGIGRLKVYDRATGTEKTVTNSTDYMSVAAATDINTGTGVITKTSHGRSTGTPVQWFTNTGTLPTQTSGSISGIKYLRSVSANTFTLHPTLADANANTNVILYSSAGSGTVCLGVDLYLFHSSPETGFYARTYKDVTFLVNRSVTVAMSSSLSATRTSEVLVRIKDYVSGATYSVTVNFGATSITKAPTGADVNAVAADLVTKLAADANWPAGTTLTQYGNVVHISKSTLTSVKVSDNRAGTAIASFKDQVLKTGDLTPYGPNGYLVKVAGTSSTAGAQDANTADDQYYSFVADDGTGGSGKWVETVAPGIKYSIDAKTAPHILTRNSDGTFTLATIPWGTRDVGDETTNPDPIFIGQTIHSLYLLGTRLGFLAGNQFINSRVGEESYYEFFRSTTAATLDDDPVYGAVPSEQVNKVFHPVAWNGDLVLFGDKADGVVSYGSKFSLGNINITTPTVSGVSQNCSPILSGSDLLFVVESGNFSNIGSYEIDQVTSIRSAESITDSYLGRYIPKNVKRMAGPAKDFVALLSTDDRNKLYVMTYSKKEQRLIQRAIVTWDFSNVPDLNILDIGFDKAYLYITYAGPGGKFYVGRVDTSVGASDDNFARKCCLDHRMAATGTYNAGLDQTTFTLGQPLSDGDKRAVIKSIPTDEERYALGEGLTIASSTDSTLVVNGDLSDPDISIYAGYGYERYFIPNPINKFANNNGAKVVDTLALQNLNRVAIGFFNTQYFKAQIISKQTGRTLSEREFSALKLDNIDAKLDDNGLTYTGVLLISGENADVTNSYIKIVSDSHLPYFIDTIQWLATDMSASV